MNLTQALKHGLIAAVLALLTGLSGCAHYNNPRDPLESFNRGVYAFNDGVDTAILKPIAQGYRAVLPQVVRTGVGNYFSNLDDVTVIVNGVLQLKIPQATSDLGRFLINSTIGLLGLFDVATELGLEKHNEDFGQTLAAWGTPDGPYLVLPILGPSTTRDAVGLIGDYFTDPEFAIFTESPENSIAFVTRIVSVRADLLDSEQIFNAAAVDRYAFLRDAYLQRRHNLINDGRAPRGTEPGAERHRKTLKEMEDELDTQDPPK